MSNIVLLGASNSRIPGGLGAGLNQDNINFTNLSLGATSSLHKLYSLKREENQEMLKKADLIIIEVNIMDIHMCYELDLKMTLTNIINLYDELAVFPKRILILLLFDYRSHKRKASIVNKFHKYKAKEYGYNVIDINNIVNKFNLNDFFMKPDCYHMLTSIMYQLGKNIASNISCFHFPYKNKQYNHQFEIITPDELEIINGDRKRSTIRYFDIEKIIKIIQGDLYKIPNKYNGFKLIGMHTFNNMKSKIIPRDISLNASCNYSSLLFSNSRLKIIKSAFGYNIFLDIRKRFIIDSNTTISFNDNFEHSEISHAVFKFNNHINTLDYVNLVSLFVVKEDSNAIKNINYDWLYQREINIDEKYNFDHLIPDLLLVKESIEEYCIKMDPIKLASLQNQTNELYSKISSLEQDNISLKQTLNSLPTKKQRLELANLEQDLVIKKLESKKLAKSLGIKMSIINPKITFIQANSAKTRIQNHLSYKLGQALIENSKSILGYIRMLYVLSYIKDKHKFEQKAYEEKIKENPNLALPPLETYPDYNEALKEKECFTYKLGLALIEANKKWYGGGVYQIVV
ncbi:sugar transferase [Campylobacter jejuni subsp. doylei]|uniref:Sugar transferase n=1 Tax=Campylobacter jejuni subsp. doylei TaxID=32021 RepID=A0A448J8N5_CAMJU|nr:SGNH/GDSL hydrolase family protein [Campylobacter jejuni]VEG61066.1 sugar transferase [Campylobacter jejuni subsp. doylei]